MYGNKFFWLVCLIIPLILMAACETEDWTSEYPDFPEAAPLLYHPDLEGLVSLEVRQVTVGSIIWVLDIAFENNSGYELSSGSLPDRLEFFDGQYWRDIPRYLPVESYAFTIFPRDVVAYYETWQYTIRLDPRHFGLDGPDGEPLAEFPPGPYRLRHSLQPYICLYHGRNRDVQRISNDWHEVVAEFQLY